MKIKNTFNLILLTPLYLLLSHYLSVFPHEFSHSFMAWVLGFKANPFLLDFGGNGWPNLLLLNHIYENVDYQLIFSSAHPAYASLIAFAGPGIANGSLFVLSYFLLKNETIKKSPYLFYFIFWFNLMNLGNFYDYVPIRTFSNSGDIYNFVTGLNISPWWIFGIVGYLVAFLIWQFFTHTLISTFVVLDIETVFFRATIMTICVFLLFGFFGGFPYVYLLNLKSELGTITFFLSASSFIAIPGIILFLWPTRQWVLEKVIQLNQQLKSLH